MMQQIQKFLNKCFTQENGKKLLAYIVLILVIFLFKWFIWIFFLTFIFAYLFYSFWKFLNFKLRDFIQKRNFSKSRKKFLKKLCCVNLVVVLEYIVFLWFLLMTIWWVLPKFLEELQAIPETIPFVADQIEPIINKLEGINNLNNEISGTIDGVLTSQDYWVILNILGKIKTAGYVILQILFALVLSLVFILDRHNLTAYLYRLKRSSYWFFYDEYEKIGTRVVESFGLIFKAQSMIAWVNAILTTCGLILIGLVHGQGFPYLLTLGLFVFIAGFIPVLWTFISSIPILFVAFHFIGWYQVVVEIVLLIGIIHMIEAYYLNPKIVSNFIQIPVSLTFVILLISEHFFGFAGLLIWMSFFYFFMTLLSDADKVLKKKKPRIEN